jgi:hypothetical protein
LKARRAWNNIFQALKKNNCQSRLLCSAKLFFIIKEEIREGKIKENDGGGEIKL